MSRRYRDLYAAARARLATRLPEAEAARDARLLLAHAAGLSGATLSVRLNDLAEAGLVTRYDALIAARLMGQSVPHIIGVSEFMGRSFAVGAGDLAPRPDTETLVEAALAHPFSRFLDLGTGTGVIAISLLAARTQAQGVATDVDEAALARARQNAQAHGVAGRLQFHAGDWFAALPDGAGRFDLILSNPPYIDRLTYETLPPELRRYERAAALTDGGDGLAAYRAIAKGAPDYLTPRGLVMVEIGYDQGHTVPAVFAEAGYDDIRLIHDLAEKPRVVVAQTPQ
ncbi:peptide chain release factor N(5)-glutamine methyltransferase [Rhodobacteraceae bacterium XHP0102]|nr:peptide chain release factor N(5)-glutamine methyltransferase [Rhodobacteraceae bacterium XHP0102]